MYFWVLLLKINRILSLVQLLYDQNVSKFIINGNCFKKKRKKKSPLKIFSGEIYQLTQRYVQSETMEYTWQMKN